MVKLINNTLAAVNAAALAEALTVAARGRLDLDALLEVVAASSGDSTMLELKARPMLDHDFTPLFKLEHMLKDVRLCLRRRTRAGHPVRWCAELAAIAARKRPPKRARATTISRP